MRHSLVIVLGLFWSLTSCSSFDGIRVAAGGIGGGVPQMDLDDLDLDDGTAVGGSVRVTRRSEDFPSIDAGFRLDLIYKEADGDDGIASADVETFEVSVAPMIRYKPFDPEASLVPFFDFFLGYTHNFGDIDLSAGALDVSDSPDGGGVWYGLGVGFEWQLTEAIDLELSVEHAWLDYEMGRVDDVDETRFQGFVGLSYTF